jgi:hypothetical protein
MSVESWGQLRTALRECHDFIEEAISDTEEIGPGEWCGAMHGARLLGHVTDAMLLATWIAGVAEAFEQKDGT